MLKKINIEHLRVGMHVHELCGSWMEHPFWRTKFVIKDADEIRLIVDSAIKEVWIDVAKGIDVSAPAKTSEEVAAGVDAALMNAAVATGTPLQVVPPKRTAMSEELKRAARICTSAKSAVVAMFNEVRMGKAISGEAAGEQMCIRDRAGGDSGSPLRGSGGWLRPPWDGPAGSAHWTSLQSSAADLRRSTLYTARPIQIVAKASVRLGSSGSA